MRPFAMRLVARVQHRHHGLQFPYLFVADSGPLGGKSRIFVPDTQCGDRNACCRKRPANLLVITNSCDVPLLSNITPWRSMYPECGVLILRFHSFDLIATSFTPMGLGLSDAIRNRSEIRSRHRNL